ncbi:MAG: TetR/AcrR family transcriptional regulator [Saprospiraceae bacterium]|uniref:TetR/AcrR family transcriptional regulator n=1 Tax=Candidatus Brachybacter algidus TaxID=2982024 RepID=UPI001B78A2F3|nr:TetR family transcriptional regulator [Candidatus Brachybacter algidus]MBP7305794.1 TetR/AcrR family transcriptional regulator [Saprospiraceae bacterium]MBK6374429.1 TetR/AcrR family transcriptional regulator [Candidatus Brachybacter algidus]MBK6450752.1 TetR/AcrR family transcriptional regulator [Candidatus Brachybacter algidus]MBK8748359.1 TetR/AcrR family transcriptional regulator [Candidatus Brachybacter algidus]MBK8844655.1 TetR/AcrR family transcriptional regulator [Candidatus Brachyb
MDKKTSILEAAIKLFSTKGYDAASVRDIAELAGVNLAMISYYFGSKEKLMESLFHEKMDASKIKIETILKDTSLTPFEKVERMLSDYVSKVVANQSFYKIMLYEQVLKQNPVILKLIKELKLNYAFLTSELIKEGQRSGDFKKEVDVILALNTLTGTVTQAVINQDYYFEFNNYQKLTTKERNELLYDKLYNHQRIIFKTLLGYEK